MLLFACRLGLARDAHFFRIGPELLIPEGDAFGPEEVRLEGRPILRKKSSGVL